MKEPLSYSIYEELSFRGKSKPKWCLAHSYDGGIGYQVFTTQPRGVYNYWYKSRTNELEMAEYLCVSTFKKCKGGRTRENVEYVTCLFVDLDGPTTTEAILKKIVDIGLSYCTIVRTSPGRFQLKWMLRVPVLADVKNELAMWKKVQSLLHEYFKELGSDGCVIHDIVRLLRNPLAEGRKNKKYADEPEVQLLTDTSPTSMRNIYDCFARAGLVKTNRRDKRNWVNRHERVWQVIDYLKRNPVSEMHQSTLADEIGIPVRTLKRILQWMREKNMIHTEVVGTGKHRKTRLVSLMNSNGFRHSKVKVHKDNILDVVNNPNINNNTKEESTEFKEENSRCRDVIKQFLNSFYPLNRNIRLFTAVCTLREIYDDLTVDDALSELNIGIRMYEARDFNRAEILKTIKSALCPKYSGFRFSTQYLEAGGYTV
ncbi:MAG: hypothetical protein ACHQ6U_12835 [Thermodesulfobacteriota bacterium]